MIAKGLDFPNVTLVGVINADTALHLPDFRAAERTFQLIAQVAGRTGRGKQGGRVLVQTLSPDHPAIAAAVRHDFPKFAAHELARAPSRRLPAVLRDGAAGDPRPAGSDGRARRPPIWASGCARPPPATRRSASSAPAPRPSPASAASTGSNSNCRPPRSPRCKHSCARRREGFEPPEGRALDRRRRPVGYAVSGG